jgi:hypothetical protein
VTLPAVITVTGIVRDKSGPVAGRIVFARSAVLFPASAADQNLLIPEQVVTTVGVDGTFSQPLYASNDPVASPTGWTWEVRPHFPNWKTPFSIVVPYDAASGTINLNELAPVPPDGTGQLYALANHTHAGGGSVTYGPVTTETAYGASSNSGVSDAISRADHRHGNPALPTPADIGASVSTHNHNAAYDTLGAATAAVSAHVAASDPHSQYLTSTEGDAAYQPLDADLTTIAGLAATSGNTVMAQGSAWASRTPAQVRTSLVVNALVLLGPLDPVPGGLPANTIIVRTT